MKFRGVTRRGKLDFNGLRFSSTPAIYELTSDEAAVLQNLHGDRVTLEFLEAEPPLEPAPMPRRRTVAVGEDEAQPVELGVDQ